MKGMMSGKKLSEITVCYDFWYYDGVSTKPKSKPGEREE